MNPASTELVIRWYWYSVSDTDYPNSPISSYMEFFSFTMKELKQKWYGTQIFMERVKFELTLERKLGCAYTCTKRNRSPFCMRAVGAVYRVQRVDWLMDTRGSLDLGWDPPTTTIHHLRYLQGHLSSLGYKFCSTTLVSSSKAERGWGPLFNGLLCPGVL